MRLVSGRAAPFVLAAVAGLAFVIGAGGTSSQAPTVSSSAGAWRGLAGSERPQVDVGQRVIVVLKAPSLAQRVAGAGGRATDSQERQWTTAALAAQQQVLAALAQHGVQVRVDYYYSRVINGFSASLDSEAVALLEREPEVAGVYPVRAAYPATISSELLAKDELARGAAHRPEILLPGFDGRGVTIALLDTGVDRAQPFLRGRVQDGINILSDGDFKAIAATKPDDATRLERHGTEMAGLLVGGGGPSGLSGVATGASVLPIRVAGWQRDAGDGWAVYSRTDQLIAGLERAVDPNEDGDAHDAARIALVPLAAPYAAFADAPDARAVEGALDLDTLVVTAAGNDGPAGPAFGSLSSPGAAPAALSVGAADLRTQTEQVRVVVRAGLAVLVDRLLPLAGAVLPRHASELALATPRKSGSGPGPNGFLSAPSMGSFFSAGNSVVAGRAALVRAGDDPVTAVENAARAGAAAVVLYGTAIPAGGLGLDESVPVPVVAVPDDVASTALSALSRGEHPALSLGATQVARNGNGGEIAPFSSHGLAFDWRVKPDLVGPAVALMTSEPSAAEDGTAAYGTVNGSSAAAATVAGAAALLAQARPDLDAQALRSILAGYAQPFPDAPVTAQGTGLVDVGASAAAEVETDPTSLAFGPAARPNWSSVQKVKVRSISNRRLYLRVALPQTGGAGLALTATPAIFRLDPGGEVTIRVKASFAGTPTPGSPAAGTMQISSRATLPLRIPWTIPFGRSDAPLLSELQLSKKIFKPSDTSPAVLSFRAGDLSAGDGGNQVQPVGRLDMVLTNSEGLHLGLLVRMRDLLPGSYAFGLTGRDPNGNTLPTGDYTLTLGAFPPDGSRPTFRKVTFSIK
jgi:Subtilase family/Peptidase inhibitor I9